MGLICVVSTYTASRWKKKMSPIYSISLFVLFLSSLYLFYTYATQQPDEIISKAYLYISIVLFFGSIILITQKIGQKSNDGLTVYLKALEKKWSLSKFNRIWIGIVSHVLLTLIIWTLLLNYQTNFGRIENEYYPMVFEHIFWQYIYVIPLVILTRGMGLYRFSITFLIFSLVYSSSYLAIPYVYLSALEFLSNFIEQL